MKMAAAMPSAEGRRNGLLDLTKRLVDDPKKPVICVVLLDCNQTLVDHDKNTRNPTVRLLHVEPMTDRGQREMAQNLLLSAYQARTSQQLELPLFDEDAPQDLDLDDVGTWGAHPRGEEQ